MSEAAKPTMNPDEPQPTAALTDSAPKATTEVTTEAPSHNEASSAGVEQEWQTVDFPGAIKVGTSATPSASTGFAQSTPVSSPLTESEAKSETTIEQLQRENAILHTQVAQLQEDLNQAQIELQLETARFYCKNEQDDRASTEASAQPNADQERSQVESLMAQVETSQQRIAQLERDCALSQQRYDEQVQLVSQAENTCRDLRMRLHRQQQQTLQFKAALEKSIEMNATVETEYASQLAIAPPLADPTAQAFIPKARPVQPWRLASGAMASGTTASGTAASGAVASGNIAPGTVTANNSVPRLLSISRPPTAQLPATETPVESAPALTSPHTAGDSANQADQALETLFPATTRPAIAAGTSSELVFDLSPFIEAGEVDPDSIVAANPAQADVIHPTKQAHAPVATPARSTEDSLWTDLARLIEPQLTEPPSVEPQLTESPSTEPASTAEATADAAIAPTQVAEAQPAAPLPSRSIRPISLVTFSAAESAVALEQTDAVTAPQHNDNPFPSFDLHSADADSAIAAESAQSSPDTTLNLTAVTSKCPSPVLYPFRQPKKLPSMAAVDLPSFPR